jgi:hypothetical protein
MKLQAIDLRVVEDVASVAVTVLSGMIFLSIPVFALISSI